MGKKEFDAFVSGITRQRIASICLALGWNSVHQSSMEIMQDLLIRYIRMLGMGAQARAELCNRTQSNIVDIQRLFDDLNINLGELEEYIEKVDDRALITDQIPTFPAPSKTDLNFLKPGSQEVLHRKSHIEHYFPPMHPELEKEDDETGGISNLTEGANGVKAETGGENSLSGNVSPSGTSGGRILTEKEAELNPFREMDSVMMTSSGFISPAREGRLPDALRPAVSALATASLPQDIDSATPPGTPTPPPFNQDHMSNVSSSTTISPKKRGPVPGSRHKRKRDATPHKLVNPDDSPDDLSGDETYEPPPGTMLDDKSSSKKLSVFQRKVKPRKSPTKSANTLNAPKDLTANSEGHVDDVIRKVIERGIEESSRLQPSPKSLLSQQKGAKGTAITDNPTVPGPPPGITRSSCLPTHAQTLSPAAMSKQQPVTSPGPKKRGRKRKSELLKMEAEKAAQDASKSESSDIDICYDAPIRKKQKPPIQTALSIAQPPIELKIPQAPTLPPDASILLNNPLIPKVPYGFGDFSNFNVPSIMQSEDTAKITSSERDSSGLRSFKSGDSSLVGIGFGNNQAKDSFPFDKHERKKDKIGKKSKKDKKEKDKNKGRDKNKDKDKLKEKKDKDKGKEKDKEKSKGKRDRNKELKREKKREEKERLREEKRERKREEKEKDKKEKKKKKLMKLPTVQMPPLFAPAEEVLPVVQSQPSVPKIKIKDIKPDEKPTKIVFKNVPGEQQQYPGSNMQVNILKHSTLKPHGPADNYVNVNINTKDKKQKSSKKKEKTVDLHYPQEVEPLKLNKKNIKQDKRERVSSGDIAKRKIRDAPVFTHGLSKPDYIDVEPGASSSNSPQISGISSPSSFVGGGTITTQTVGKYVDQDGRGVWICPGCGKQDDGSPMIGCDSCDDWYHWVCVNVHQEPADEDWFCPRCRARKSGSFLQTSNLPQGQQTSKRAFSVSAGRGGRPPKTPKV